MYFTCKPTVCRMLVLCSMTLLCWSIYMYVDAEFKLLF